MLSLELKTQNQLIIFNGFNIIVFIKLQIYPYYYIRFTLVFSLLRLRNGCHCCVLCFYVSCYCVVTFTFNFFLDQVNFFSFSATFFWSFFFGLPERKTYGSKYCSGQSWPYSAFHNWTIKGLLFLLVRRQLVSQIGFANLLTDSKA